MGIYTIYDIEDIDQNIQKKLDYIVDRILEFIGSHNILAIILTGGFGRGEGGVVLENQKIRLINDLDINIICKASKYRSVVSKSRKDLEPFAQKLAAEVEIKQVDLGIIHPAKFYFMTNKVSSYEYRHGHKILYGKIDIKNKIKEIKPEELPITDGAQYFLTRGSGMIIPALTFYKTYHVLKRYRENFYIELNKAILAMGDALLLLNRKYRCSYKERLTFIGLIYFGGIPNGEVIKRLYKEALKWKLKPEFEWHGDKKEIERWFYIRDLFSDFFLWFENKRLNRQYLSWFNYISDIYSIQDEFGIPFIRKLHARLGFKHGKKNFPAKLAIMPAILFSLNRDFTFNGTLIESAQRNLENYYKVYSELDWFDVAKNYLRIFHPGGIVSKIINK